MKGKKTYPVLEVALREAERIKRNPAYRFLLFGGPLLGILLLFFIFLQGAVKEMPIAVVDKDNSSLSVKIANAIDASSDVSVILNIPDLFEAKKLMEQGFKYETGEYHDGGKLFYKFR